MSWSKEDKKYLEIRYENSSKEDILTYYVDKTWKHIVRYANKRKLKRNPAIALKTRSTSWETEDIEYINKAYFEIPNTEIIDKLGKSWSTIKSYCRRNNIKRSDSAIKKDISSNNPKKVWSEGEDTILKKSYGSVPKEELLNLLSSRNWKSIRYRAVILDISRNKEVLKKEKSIAIEKSNWDKYGVKSTWELASVKEKIKESNLDRHGVEYPMQSSEIREKSKKTVQEKYGVGHISQVPEVREKVKKTVLKKYGVENPNQSPGVQEKIKVTNLERYGVENIFQSEEIKDKIKETNLERYGVINPQQNKEIRKKTEKTNIKKYGGVAPFCDPVVQEIAKKTNQRKYGTDWAWQSPEVKKKIVETNLERYGVTNPAKTAEVQAKIVKTNIERYGVPYTQQDKEIRKKGYLTAKENKSFVKSKPESILFKLLKKYFDSDIQDQIRHPELDYVIDFYSLKYDLWIQLDGTYWHGKNKTLTDVTNKIKNYEKNGKKSRYSGVLSNMKNDIIQNKVISNLVRFWDDEMNLAIKNETIEKFLKDKLCKKIDI